MPIITVKFRATDMLAKKAASHCLAAILVTYIYLYLNFKFSSLSFIVVISDNGGSRSNVHYASYSKLKEVYCNSRGT